ncbi:MAG: aminopeptidase [Gaiella sp.]
MADPRDDAYAELIVRCLRIEPGWQVWVGGNLRAAPLLERVSALVGERGAYALTRLSLEGSVTASPAWLQSAPLELLARPAPLVERELREVDALLFVQAPENTRTASAIDAQRLAAVRAAYRTALERVTNHDIPWMACQYPTPALAQDAGLATEAFADLLYDAVLQDWEALGEIMRRRAARFDAAREVRIVGAGTDLTLSLEGRSMRVDALGANLPGGEFFGCPVEDSAEGVIHFSEFPAVYGGREVTGARLRFEAGVVVDASADGNEAFLLETLDSDPGARRLGELGIGCNPGITRFMRNTLFDEKIDGTVHVALGQSYTDLGGTNESRIHWDLVKDLRSPSSRIELDGEAVQRDGVWAL